mmetsp:Transcript_27791/g.70194  ORF Transcript_27791/g.70194 Transcript_27791/m.70194 type:complete len:417 (+) Transcript_27791:69-1319(+)
MGGSKMNPEGEFYVESETRLFIGAMGPTIKEEQLRDHFSKFGAITECNLKSELGSGKSKGYAFISFEDPAALQNVLSNCPHVLEDKVLDVKRAKEIAETDVSSTLTTKIFVGALPLSCTGEKLKEYFGKYGPVTASVVITDHETKESRGFGFVNFKHTDAVAKCLEDYHEHFLDDKWIETKCCLPREGQSGKGEGGKQAASSYKGGGHQNQLQQAPGKGGQWGPQQQMAAMMSLQCGYGGGAAMNPFAEAYPTNYDPAVLFQQMQLAMAAKGATMKGSKAEAGGASGTSGLLEKGSGGDKSTLFKTSSKGSTGSSKGNKSSKSGAMQMLAMTNPTLLKGGGGNADKMMGQHQPMVPTSAGSIAATPPKVDLTGLGLTGSGGGTSGYNEDVYGGVCFAGAGGVGGYYNYGVAPGYGY